MSGVKTVKSGCNISANTKESGHLVSILAASDGDLGETMKHNNRRSGQTHVDSMGLSPDMVSRHR